MVSQFARVVIALSPIIILSMLDLPAGAHVADNLISLIEVDIDATAAKGCLVRNVTRGL